MKAVVLLSGGLDSATALAMAVATLFAQPVVQAQETTDKKLQAVEVVGTSPLPGLGIEKNKLFSIVYSVADMVAGYDKLRKLADGHVNMVVPGHDAEVMKRFFTSACMRGFEPLRWAWHPKA